VTTPISDTPGNRAFSLEMWRDLLGRTLVRQINPQLHSPNGWEVRWFLVLSQPSDTEWEVVSWISTAVVERFNDPRIQPIDPDRAADLIR